MTNFNRCNIIFDNFQQYLNTVNIKNHPVLINHRGYLDPNEGFGVIRNKLSSEIEYPIKCVENEIRELVLVLLHYKSTGSILEIGLGTGAAHKLWCLLFEKRIVTIDINNEKLLNFSRKGLDGRSFLIHTDSHSPIAAVKTREKCDNELFDVLFLNGNSSYESVKADFFIWKDLVRKGGMIVFNNINSDMKGVKRFVIELESGIYSDIPVTIRKIIYSKECGIGYLIV